MPQNDSVRPIIQPDDKILVNQAFVDWFEKSTGMECVLVPGQAYVVFAVYRHEVCVEWNHGFYVPIDKIIEFDMLRRRDG